MDHIDIKIHLLLCFLHQEVLRSIVFVCVLFVSLNLATSCNARWAAVGNVAAGGVI